MPGDLNSNQRSKLLQIVADPPDEERLLNGVFEFLSTAFKGMYFSLWLRDVVKRRAFAILVGEQGYMTRGVINIFERIPEGEGAVGRTLQSGETLVLDMKREAEASIPADQEFVRGEGFRSILCVPASTGTEVTGVLLTARRDTNKWSSSEIATLTFICREAIVALGRASRASENRILVQMLSQSHAWTEADTVLKQIASLLSLLRLKSCAKW